MEITQEKHDLIPENYPLLRSLIWQEYHKARKENGNLPKEAFAVATERVATLLTEPTTGKQMWMRLTQDMHLKRMARKRSQQQGYLEGLDAEGLLLKVETPEEDPFHTNLLRLVEATFKGLKAGEYLATTWKDEITAHKAQKSLYAVSRKYGWKQYKTKVAKRVLYVKRVD